MAGESTRGGGFRIFQSRGGGGVGGGRMSKFLAHF